MAQSLTDARRRLIAESDARRGLVNRFDSAEDPNQIGAIAAGRILAALSSASEVMLAIQAGLPRAAIIELTALLTAYLGLTAVGENVLKPQIPANLAALIKLMAGPYNGFNTWAQKMLRITGSAHYSAWSGSLIALQPAPDTTIVEFHNTARAITNAFFTEQAQLNGQFLAAYERFQSA